MFISKVVIENYRCLRRCTTVLNKMLNIIVGNNECGKSTLLEAVYLALSGYLNRSCYRYGAAPTPIQPSGRP